MSNPLYSAIKRSVTGKLLTYLIQFFALAIYARIFTPEQFGIIASIQVFVIFFQLLADIGIGPAIINEDTFTKAQRNGIFTTTLILGIILATLFYCFSYFLTYFYNGYNYQNIAIIVSIGIIFNSLNIIPLTALNKDASFIKIAKIDCVTELISLSIVYYFSLLEFGAIALATRSLSQGVIKFILTWFSSAKTSLGRPYFGSELYHIKKIAGFASYQFSFNLINYFSRNLDKILIGKYIGTSALGVYEKSYQLMQYPLMLTTFAMTPAIQPILTKLRSNVDLIVEEHNKLASRLLFISILISFFIYINSENIVLFLFGSQWEGVTPLIKLFSFMIPIQAILSTSGSFYQVMNKPQLLFISGLLSAILNIIAICLGVYFNELRFIAIGLIISFSANFLQCYFIMFKYCFKRNIYLFYKKLMKAILIASMMCSLYIVLLIIMKSYLSTEIVINILQNLLLTAPSFGIFYILNRKLNFDI
ncbi:oligosaccharide flippase family protein [Providencia alcalifaciens]|uniref:oligosaccharide flippase family protein n=1 Tax=Providencia alcalifaciens TaxID=126385 RepID=UPI00044C1B9B|nr:oligosaccharide flippase family protein [Providencia alcalifaciens]ETT07688.1 polysaccharide biosynthesis protein [Providencia alcalifaciens F90-2004]EUC94998.1 polysaccharide biosynthesis protein [Providencia alcalifaciens PAL-2]MTB33173.1 oligosaccharide flippase family protein [Providencia alcalifaciens]MTC97590.1 oligosaccharide flippase family protein [Providencia alcalifaciens]